MNNLDIRQMVDQYGVKYQSIARKMGISASWLSQLMRKELTVENKMRVISAIRSLQEVNNDLSESYSELHER